MTEPIELVASADRFEAIVRSWRREPVVGIDTEAASFHRYHDRVYLLQLSSPTATVVVDPLASGGVTPLADWFASGETEFVFHDADYDLRLMHHEAGLRLKRLFDTRVAAQFLNLPGIGLATLLEARFGVKTDKRFQRADWSARPLRPDMIEYAATDTRYLPALRTELREELARKGRLGWVEEESDLLTRVQWGASSPPEEAFLRLKGARDLDRRGLAILRELFVWRERLAERLDRAVFRVLANETLILLAQLRPQDLSSLASIRGVGPDNATRRGAEIVAAIARGIAVPERDLPYFERRPRYRPDPAFDAALERLKAWRATAAVELDLPTGLVAPNATLEAIARATPKDLAALSAVPGLRRWQTETLGAGLLAALAAA